MSRIIVTGAAGFIGSNIVLGLNARGISDVIVVDDLTDGSKFRNLANLSIADYVDAADFYPAFTRQAFGKVEAIFHEGACSDTMESNGQYMMANNFGRSKEVFHAAQAQKTRLLYASSAATYGGSSCFKEQPEFEQPLNVYGYSKLLFDQYLRQQIGSSLDQGTAQTVGFRYFNVYGPCEQHKGRMASVAFHQFRQYRAQASVQLFGEYGGYAPGGQLRDFVFVDDVVAVNLWFFDHPERSGIFNLGTGRAQPFNDIAVAVANAMRLRAGNAALPLTDLVQAGVIRYMPFPEALRGKYQCFTQADLSALRQAGCMHAFADVATGVSNYISWLAAHADLS
jgi:ADP-L-glycero-D-manno-heptose 6-epimerase